GARVLPGHAATLAGGSAGSGARLLRAARVVGQPPRAAARHRADAPLPELGPLQTDRQPGDAVQIPGVTSCRFRAVRSRGAWFARAATRWIAPGGRAGGRPATESPTGSGAGRAMVSRRAADLGRARSGF